MTEERRLRTRDELLAQVRAAGTARRRRFIAITSGSVLALIAVVVLVVSGPSSPHRDRVTANDPHPTTSTSTTVEDTVPTTTLTLPHRGAVTTTTALVCRNSTNPVCGPLVWDPPVQNQPGTISATQLPRQQGDATGLVRLQVTYSDPDSGPIACRYAYDADGPSNIDAITKGQACGGGGPPLACSDAYGPWDTTPPHPSSDTYESGILLTPGAHTVVVGVELTENTPAGSVQPHVCDPYSEDLQNTVDIVVPG
jgi:hypothetical protein